MTDNIAVTPGTGTTIAADDIGAGVLAQRVKPVWGPDGTGNDVDIASGKPLPVQLRSPTGVDLTGPAGTASAAVQTVQGIAGGVPHPFISGQAADVTGTFTNATQTTSITTGSITGYQSVSVSINGTFGTGTAVFEVSDDGGTTWFGAQGARSDSAVIENGYTSLTNTQRMWIIPITGADKFRVRSTAVASGTVNVVISPVGAATADSAVVSIGSALPTGTNSIGAVTASGDTASGATDGGNPVKTGGLAKTSNPTAVTDGQRVASLFDKLGKQVVVGAIRDLKGMQSTTITSSTAETTIVTAVASTFLDLYGLVITNTSATATKVTVKDSTSGTTRAVYEAPAADTRGFMLPVDSALPQATVNNNWTATCGTSVASVEIAAYYVKNI